MLWVAILSGSVNSGGKTEMERCWGGLYYIPGARQRDKSTELLKIRQRNHRFELG